MVIRGNLVRGSPLTGRRNVPGSACVLTEVRSITVRIANTTDYNRGDRMSLMGIADRLIAFGKVTTTFVQV